MCGIMMDRDGDVILGLTICIAVCADFWIKKMKNLTGGASCVIMHLCGPSKE
jgi:hypothetical protein